MKANARTAYSLAVKQDKLRVQVDIIASPVAAGASISLEGPLARMNHSAKHQGKHLMHCPFAYLT